ncbi:hypothetical protein ACHAW6_012211 [Cyclotella cf. meneghiniana]
MVLHPHFPPSRDSSIMKETNRDIQHASTDSSVTHPKQKRPTCQKCHYPPRTCVCPSLPATPLHTLFRRCRIVVLQHPHETRRKNRSLPLVDLCLFGEKNSDGASRSLPPRRQDFVMKTIVGRSFGPDRDAAIIELLSDPDQVVVMVFPHRNAVDFERGMQMAEKRCGFRKVSPDEEGGASKPATKNKKMTLLFIDATWKHAREMEAKLSKSVECRHWIRVQLVPAAFESCDGSDERSPSGNDTIEKTSTDSTDSALETKPFVQRRFQIRAPPSPNHLSTAECLAWVASRVEGNPAIFETITNVLDYMVFLWRANVVGMTECGKRGWDTMSQKALEIHH